MNRSTLPNCIALRLLTRLHVSLLGAVALFWAMGTMAYGQVDAMHRCRIQLQPHLANLSPKLAVATVSDWMEVVDIDLEQDGRVLRFTTATPLSLEQLRQRLQTVNYGVRGAACFNKVSGELLEEGLPPFPEFLDSGNEAADHATYDAAKAAWVARHPEAYQRMMHPVISTHAQR